MVGEIKKGQYIYYHCSHAKRSARSPREERLVEKFCVLLQNERLTGQSWSGRAHRDEKQFHDEAITRLQAQYVKLEDRLDAMYVDKLDGRIEVTFFDRKASEWRAEQHRIRQTIQTQSYFDEGLRLLELARRAHMLFRQQPANEKRRLLGFVVSNCTWKQGELRATYHQPFDLLAIAAKGAREESPPGESSRPVSRNWLPELDSNQQPPG